MGDTEQAPTSLLMPKPRAADSMNLQRISPKVTLLELQGDYAILFYEGEAIAVSAGGVVSFYCEPGAELAAVNRYAEDKPTMRVSASSLDFLVGQVLVGTGLPLTRGPA